jgi:hypothetical protein
MEKRFTLACSFTEFNPWSAPSAAMDLKGGRISWWQECAVEEAKESNLRNVLGQDKFFEVPSPVFYFL